MNNRIIKGIECYHKNIKNDRHCRYLSWEHCYLAFYNAIKKGDKREKTIDYLCLQLAFYLASWGMYRGSSFLLQRDYTIHKKPIEIILDNKYKCLLGINCDDLKDKIGLLFELVRNFEKEYITIKKGVTGNDEKSITDTLITKILLGTLGCVPAYDKNYKNCLKKLKIKRKFNEDSIKQICQYYTENKKELERIRKTMHLGKIEYPQMKLIDMGFWMVGQENNSINKKT